MSKHSPEPWKFEGSPNYCSEIFGSNGESVCTFVYDPSGVDIDRILSCVNACAEMDYPAKEIADLRRQRDETISQLTSQKDRLTEFAEYCAQYLGDGTADSRTYRDIVSDIGTKARALLAELATEDGD